MTKFAAYVGNDHAKVRVTPFFATRSEAKEAAIARNQLVAFVMPCANWEEHMKWNAQRIGMYKDCPVTE